MYIKLNGENFFAATGGQPFSLKKPCIVFIHGAAMDHSIWMLQTRYFAHHGYSVLALDLPAHGRSSGAPIDSVLGMAEWLKEILDSLDVKQTIMVGHSLGSLVALEFSSKYSKMINSLALLGISAPMPVHDELYSNAEKNSHLAFELINSWGFGRKSQVGHNQIPGVWMTGNSIRLMESSSDGVLYSDLTAVKNYSCGLEAASKVVCPTLIVIGEKDKMTPPRATSVLNENLSNSDVFFIQNCGHMPMVEKPEELLFQLEKHFLKISLS